MSWNKNDTICAPSTPLIESAIGIIRVSGQKALEIALSVFRPSRKIEPEVIVRGKLILNDIEDRGIMVFFKGPRSYTGEDVVEIYTHGNPILMQKVLEKMIAHGARPANPGEFTKRAFINGKMDLTQAESIARLIGARSEEALKLATRVLGGELKEKVESLRKNLLDVMVSVETAIEFPEDAEVEAKNVKQQLSTLKSVLEEMIEGYEKNKKLFEGYRIVIAGRPNAGKSTLFNKLLGYPRAIVTPHPGTTRDYIESSLFINGHEVKLYDTAGLREKAEEIESMGIKFTRNLTANADLILLIIDGHIPPSLEDEKFINEFKNEKTILILNKKDIGIHPYWKTRKENFVQISALTGDGIDKLKKQIVKNLAPAEGKSLLLEERHRYAMERAIKKIEAAEREIDSELWDLVAENLKGAEEALREIIGQITNDEVLNEIFARFCIGK